MEVSGSDATQAVQVALNIRPLIASERMQGCKDCISVVPGEPQVQIGVHSFTFDHVYGSTGTPLSALFSDCVAPLVDGLFHGYNATVLAYGQTGSGKTFTMGTGYTVGGTTEAVIPQVMAAIFAKIESLKQNMEFLLRVSYIEILKEEIHDLLDSSQAASKLDPANGAGMFGAVLKMSGPVKPPIQIRETTNGGIVIAGITETVVNNVSEMASCLEQGSLCRATGSTNMNSSSSRSHAIFTVTVEQRRKWDLPAADSGPDLDEMHDDFLCAKLHLVDLAGSERAKRTGADGLRFKEGVHINKGLLALGNVISALGDDKKRKEGGHVPYRDSKLTRLLQDSLGGNSRTVMIACVSPADSNAEETLNTLKYANRARNIQNKPTVNRDPIAAEMQRMRQQMDLMHAELVCARAGGTSFEDVQMLKERIAWLESTNTELQQHLDALSGRTNALSQHGLDDQDTLHSKLSKPGDRTAHLKEGNGTEENMFARRIQKMEGDQVVASDANYSAADANLCLSKRHPDSLVLDSEEVSCPSSTEEEPGGDGEEYVEAKELEHTLLQDRLDKELQELNKHLEQKEAEMKTFAKSETLVLKHHFERKLVELEDEKKLLQKERDALVLELETLTTNSDEHTQKMQEIYQQKLKLLETQISDLRKRQENQSHLLRQKQRSDEAAKRLLDDIQRIKTQKVQLQHKIKQEAEQFRIWKACREKEVLQLRKEGRRTEYEMHKLQALNQRQKMVLQRKTEEAAIATRRLKELLEARKSSPRDTASNGGSVSSVFASQSNEKALQHWLEQELEVTVRVHEVRSAYEKQAESRVTFAKELRKLQEEEEISQNSPDSRQQTPNGATTGSSPLSMSPNARRARIGLLESIVNTSSTALVSMASQLSEAEERERTLSGRARWQHLRTLGDAKNLLQFIFNAAASSRCQLRDKEEEIGELKEKIVELQELLRKRDAQRLDIERQHRLKDQAVAAVVASATKVRESHPAVNKVKLNKASMAEEFPSVVVADLSGKSVVEQRSGAASQSRITDAKDRSAENFRDFTNVDCDASLGKSSFPYTLRKASRELQSSKIARCSENDGLEAESDMDISDGGVSDEEWEHRTTRSIVKKNRDGAEKTRLRKDGKVSQVNRKSRVARPRLQDLEASQGSECRSRPPAGESVFDENERKSHSGTERCCSCSPCSGCKTRKCECKAAGGLCGPNCGCKAGKCANRESVEMEADPTAVATAVQMEMAEAVETLRMDKERRRVIEQSGNSLGGNVKQEDPWVADASTRRAQQVLALHGANVLDYAWREGQHDEEGHAIQEAAGDNSVRRTPLCDIGNKKVKAQGRTLFKHRRRAQRGSLPAERHDLRYNTLTIDAIVAASGGLPTGAGKSICDNDEGRREDTSSKMEPDETRSRSGPLLACDNMIPTGSPSFVCHRIPAAGVDDSSLSTEQLKDIDKENQFI